MSSFSKPLVSIGLPVRNGAKTLELALNSIVNQTYKHIEVIISNNASTDDTARIIEKLDILFPAMHLDPDPLLEEAVRIEEQIKAMLSHQLSASEDERGEDGPSAMLYG